MFDLNAIDQTLQQIPLRPYQYNYIAGLFNGWSRNGRTGLAVAATGCHNATQGILMYNGTVKMAAEIVVGDELMGPDSRPRTVLKLVRGVGPMVKVTPTKGQAFIVNTDHVLSFKKTPKKSGDVHTIVNMSVAEWMKLTKCQKHLLKLWRTGVLFNEDETPETMPMDPYILGVILGDGAISCGGITIHKPDMEIYEYVRDTVPTYGCVTNIRAYAEPGKCMAYSITAPQKGKLNYMLSTLQCMRLQGTNSETKFIPSYYKTASRKTRLEVLAGLMDTDGHCTEKCFDYISKSQQLSNDVAFIARSLGLAAYVTECEKGCQNNFVGTYWRVCISGDIDQIPTKIKRKQARPRRQKKSPLVTGLVVEPIGEGHYYGWTVDGDNLYLMEDFTVTHNCGKTRIGVATIRAVIENTDKKVLWISHRKELNHQAIDAITQICGCEPDLEMGDSRVDTRKNLLGGGSRVIVASIQSLMAGRKCDECQGTGGVLVGCSCGGNETCGECSGTGRRPSNQDCHICTGGIIRRLQKFNPDDFALCCVDEAHRSLAVGYRRCLRWFGRNEKAKFLLLTATPQRGDKQSLGIIADFAPDIHGVPQFGHDAERAQVADLQWGVENAWLVPVKQMFIECQSIDISGVSTKLGDLDTSEMSEVLMQEQAIHEMVMGTVKYTDSKKTVVFCNDVAHAERVAEVLNRYKPASARMVCGNKKKVTDEQRDEILTDHKAGKFQYLVNVDIVTEGYDDPSIECIVMMRAHKVLGPILQKIGRGTRPIKPADNDSELEERQAMIAASGKPHCNVIDFKVENGRHRLVTILDVLCGDVSQELLDRAKQVSIEQKQPESPEELLRLAQQQLLEEERKEQERKEAEKRAAIAARQAKFLVTERDPFSWFNSLPKTSSVDSTEASEQQKAALSRFGVEEARMAGITVASAGAMLKNLTERRNKKLCTYKQAMYLAKHGVDTRNLSFKTASSMMNALARNHYKMTDGIRAMVERKEKELV